MKIFGVLKKGKAAKNLCQVSFLISPQELRNLACFFNDHANRMESSKIYGHAHLQDFDKKLELAIRKGVEPDVVIVQDNASIVKGSVLKGVNP